MIFLHGLIEFLKLDIGFPCCSELLVDEIDPFLPFSVPLYLRSSEPFYCKIVSLSLSGKVFLVKARE